MEHEITPEPSPEEREAIDQALDRLLSQPAEARSAWWREGVRQGTNPQREERD